MRLFTCGVLLTAIASAAAAGSASGGYSDRWPGFVVLVWQYRTPPPGEEAKRVYDSLHLKGIHLDNGFPDELLDFARRNGYWYYVDHAAGKGDLHLNESVWRPFAEQYRRDRRRPERPRSLFDAEVVARLKRLLDANITRARVGRVVAYAFDDEISTGSFTTPVDLDWSPAALAEFRRWLQAEYGAIDRLNAEWQTRYASFAEAEPLGVDDLRAVHRRPFPEWNLSRWADHRTFMDWHFARLLADLRAHANALDPRTPAGFVGGQAPAAYGGFDYARLTRAVQWMEAYDIGATDEMLRSFWGQEHPRVQTFFSSGKPHQDRWFLWYYLAHGDRGVIAWPDNDGRPWFEGTRVRPDIRELAGTFREVQGPIGQLLMQARFSHDRIGVYYSHPSVQVSWFMDIEPHGETWVNRSSSMNNENASDIVNRWAWLRLLEDCGYQYEFVPYLDVCERGLDPSRYRVLILPRTLALSEAEAEAIRAFCAAGGTVVADYLPGVFDEHGRGRATGCLDALFGVRRNPEAGVLDGRNIAEVNAERYQEPLSARFSYEGALRWNGIVVYERGLRAAGGSTARASVGEADVVITRRAGRGRAVYLNLTPSAYLLHRGADGAPYRQVVWAILGGAGLHPRVRVLSGGAEVPMCERLFWQRAGRTYLFLVRNPVRMARVDGAGSVDGLAESGPIPIELEFRSPVRDLRNERTGKALGSGRRFADQWVPYEAGVYSCAG